MCRVQWAHYVAMTLSPSLLLSSSCLPPSLYASPDNEATVRGGRGESPMSTLTMATKGARGSNTPPPTLSDSCSRRQSYADSLILCGSTRMPRISVVIIQLRLSPPAPVLLLLPYRVHGHFCCDITQPPPAPGACLVSMVAFSVTVLGRLITLLRMSLRSLRLKVGQRRAL